MTVLGLVVVFEWVSAAAQDEQQPPRPVGAVSCSHSSFVTPQPAQAPRVKCDADMVLLFGSQAARSVPKFPRN
jgi:hypothetical protein